MTRPTTGVAAIVRDNRPETALVTRQPPKKRGRKVLKTLGYIVGALPPFWPITFVTWMVLRRRPKPRSMRLVKKAVRALDKGHTGVALKLLQDAHFLDPSSADALYWLGMLLSGQERHEEAAEALSLVAERVPGLPEVETALIDAYLATENPEGAVFHAQRLLDAAPYETDSLVKLADAFEASGRTDLAIQTLQQAPLHKHTLSQDLLRVHYQLGVLLQEEGEDEQALGHFKRVYARKVGYKDVRVRIEALEADE